MSRKDKKEFWTRILIILTGIFIVIFLITISIIINPIKPISAEEEKPIPTFEEFKSKEKNIPYEDLMRYDEENKDNLVCFQGKIVQVVSEGTDWELRIATKKEDYSFTEELLYYNEIVYLNIFDYTGERLLENDIVEFCGNYYGLKRYKALLGNQITIPEIDTWTPYIKRIDKK